MAAVIGKRKRNDVPDHSKKVKKASFEPQVKNLQNGSDSKNGSRTEIIPHTADHSVSDSNANAGDPRNIAVQIITGSYDRVLHGICATTSREKLDTWPFSDDVVTFTNTFLFAAHASSIRCLAISPPAGQGKRLLATGSADERINVYSISSYPPQSTSKGASKPSSLLPDPITASASSKNKPVGTLLHHDRAISSLSFPSRAKLFSSAEDSTIAITRSRDWTVLSSIKAPIPKPQGRPSGDTAAPGEIPAGVNSFAVHPSQKLMLSTGRRERCMRLWNLMTGKKAGVLNFDRSLLAQVGEGKHGTGEGRCVRWDAAGEKFVVEFERGIAVFGIDSRPKAVIKATPLTKLHQIRFLPGEQGADILAVSTEDGRLLFFDAQVPDVEMDPAHLPLCRCLGQLGGSAAGVSGRIKDFDVLSIPVLGSSPARLLVITGGSDGTVHLWTTTFAEISSEASSNGNTNGIASKKTDDANSLTQIGSLIGKLETNSRITCLEAFVMDVETSSVDEEKEEFDGFGSEDDEED